MRKHVMNNWHRRIWTLEEINIPELAMLFSAAGSHQFWFEPFADSENELRFRVQFAAGDLPDCWSRCTLAPVGAGDLDAVGPDAAERLEGTMEMNPGEKILQIYMGKTDQDQDELRIREEPADDGHDTGFAKAH
jgi:hypothetical protein